MPIHFKCHTCKRRLSVGSHKAGSEAQCPSCGATIRVPTQADVAALAAMAVVAGGDATASSPAKPAPSQLDLSDFRFEDDPPPTPNAPRQDKPVERFDPQYVSVSRTVLYAQGVLIAVAGLLCFVLGYFTGIAGGGGRPVGQGAVAANPVTIAGKLFYQPLPGQSTPDAGAVLIIFPAGAAPDERLPVTGLRPDDPVPEGEEPVIKMIQSLGGVYVRTSTDGQYKFVLPKPGPYRVLRLSKHAARAPGDEPTLTDIEALDRYFQGTADLLGLRKYTWGTVQVAANTTLAHDFGVDGG